MPKPHTNVKYSGENHSSYLVISCHSNSFFSEHTEWEVGWRWSHSISHLGFFRCSSMFPFLMWHLLNLWNLLMQNTVNKLKSWQGLQHRRITDSRNLVVCIQTYPSQACAEELGTRGQGCIPIDLKHFLSLSPCLEPRKVAVKFFLQIIIITTVSVSLHDPQAYRNKSTELW